MPLDEKDHKIIEALAKNARIAITEIAKMLNLTDVAIRKRLRKLEKNGVIEKYTVLVNPKKLGYNCVAIIGVDVEPEHLLNVAWTLAEREYTRFVALTAGEHMIIAEIWSKDNKELNKILEDIGRNNGVKRVCPSLVLDVLKR